MTMRCDILTLFPDMVKAVLGTSILKRASQNGLLDVNVIDLRDYADGRHKVADDYAYGGGPGMVLKPEPIFRAVDAGGLRGDDCRLLLLSPQGRRFSHTLAEEFANESRRLVFLCGHYEGIDERVRLGLAPEELSIGDFVLTGGELAALVIIDAAARLIPGVLGDPQSAAADSFVESMLDASHYTRPQVYQGMAVPEALLSGNHQNIAAWRRAEALRNTVTKRPDLLERACLTAADRALLEQLSRQGSSAPQADGGEEKRS
jgi:tRNA (guanine37-N1)-methyltransferase